MFQAGFISFCFNKNWSFLKREEQAVLQIYFFFHIAIVTFCIGAGSADFGSKVTWEQVWVGLFVFTL